MIIENYFLYSSRRRHTRWPRDWSSDVCSSDLYHPAMRIGMMTKSPATVQVPTGLSNAISTTMNTSATSTNQLEYGAKGKIGRASCRERVSRAGGAVTEREKSKEIRK